MFKCIDEKEEMYCNFDYNLPKVNTLFGLVYVKKLKTLSSEIPGREIGVTGLFIMYRLS